MPPRYTVRAQVVDVRGDVPRPEDRFLLDTNVMAWAYYLAAGVSAAGSSIPKVAEYAPYIIRSRHVGAIRYRTGLNLAELAHLIEANELDGYSFAAGAMPPKEYRHNVPTERARVVAEIQRVWGRVKADTEPLPVLLDDAFTDGALKRLTFAPVDGYDVFLLEVMAASGVTQILTDDGDFCCVAGIEVFTASPRVLGAARAQGRLVTR